MKKLNLFIKRTVDIIGSLVGIFVLSIVFIVIAIAIKITSPGPIFFLQERLGMKGKPFRIIKFRTMIVNAEHLGEGLRVSSESDPRITKVGRILRRFSLDELPQIFNVLAGSMSFVGPRPPVSYYPYAGYENYPEWAKMRFEMRPGITGLAQATVRNSVSWDDRIKVDNQYIEGFNIILDAKILMLTMKRVVSTTDVYANTATVKQSESKETEELILRK